MLRLGILSVTMYAYHGSPLQKKRLGKGHDRCGSTGTVFPLRQLLVDGLVVDPRDLRSPLTTSHPDERRTAENNPESRVVLIYAVDEHYELHVAVDGDRTEPGSTKHETLFHNADVRAAGEMQVFGGVILSVDDFSGSYDTYGRMQVDIGFSEAVLEAIDRISAPMTDEFRTKLTSNARRP